jgi:hypothetical protein
MCRILGLPRKKTLCLKRSSVVIDESLQLASAIFVLGGRCEWSTLSRNFGLVYGTHLLELLDWHGPHNDHSYL